MKTLARSNLAAATILAALACAVVPARADTTTYSLNTFNLGGYTGPFGIVTVDRTSTLTATITFDAADGFLFFGTNAVGVNVNSTTWTLDPTITGTNSWPNFSSPGPYSNGGAANMDGFGTFNQTIDSFDGFQHSANEIIFSITSTGTSWANATEVLFANAGGSFVAAQLGVCATATGGTQTSTCDGLGGFRATGFVSNSSTSSSTSSSQGGSSSGDIPEPNSGLIAILGLGLLGGTLVARSRSRRS